MKKDISVEEFTKALEVVTKFCEDYYLGSSRSVQMLIQAPLHYSFCEKNKRAISETTIVCMGLQILNRLYDTPYYYGVDNWVDRFKSVVCKYLEEQE